VFRKYKKNGVRVIRKTIGLSIVLAVAFLFNSVGLANDINEDTKTDIESMKYEINISQRSVEDALKTLAKQTGIQLLFPFDLVNTLNAHPVKGQYGVMEALEILLQDTGLYGGLTDSGVITISQNGFNKNGKGKRMNTNKRKNLLATFVALFASGATVQANAQNEYGESATAQNVLDEIIVTSEKREQNVQDVPVAISAFSAGMLEARGIVTAQDLQFVVPGLTIGEDFRGPAKVTIRGVSSENPFPGGDPGVPVHINGHYTQNPAYVLRDMLDVERVEVLRGPQGTLYGRNAIGGNINIITKRPTDTVEGTVSANIGNYEKHLVQGVVSGPLSDTLRARLAVSDDKRDGYVRNVGVQGDDRQTSDYTSVRGALEYDLTDNTQLYLNAYYFKDKGNSGQRLISEYPLDATLFGGPNYYILNSAGSNPSSSDPFQVSDNTPPEQLKKSKGVSVDFSWNLGGVEFRSLSAYDETTWEGSADKDGSAVVNRENIFVTPLETYTQEFQLLSTGDDDLSWVVGAFYYNEESDYHFESLREQSTFDADGNGVVDQNDPRFVISGDSGNEAMSLGAFGQLNYLLTERSELVAGLRYSKDKKENNEPGVSIATEGQPFPPPVIFKFGLRDDDWSKVTGKLGINYHLDDDVMIFGSYSRGYKAGGFNFAQENSYNPETVDAYETGLKARWLDARLQTNLAAFYYKYEDKQDFQAFFDPVLGLAPFSIVNASSATNYGVELEIQAYVTDAFFIDVSLGYLNAEFEEFATADTLRPALQNLNLSGNKLPFSPEWKAYLGIQYDWSLGDGMGGLSARLDYSWTDDQYSNAFNRDANTAGLNAGSADFLPSYYLVNASLQWKSVDDVWNVNLYVKNLTDEAILSNSFVAPLTDTTQEVHANYFAPRTYGLKMTYNFWP